MGLRLDGSTAPNYGILILVIPVMLLLLTIFIGTCFFVLKVINRVFKTNVKCLKGSFLFGLSSLLSYPVSTVTYNLISNCFIGLDNIAYISLLSYFVLFVPIAFILNLLVTIFIFRKENIKVRYIFIVSLIFLLVNSWPFILH